MNSNSQVKHNYFGYHKILCFSAKVNSKFVVSDSLLLTQKNDAFLFASNLQVCEKHSEICSTLFSIFVFVCPNLKRLFVIYIHHNDLQHHMVFCHLFQAGTKIMTRICAWLLLVFLLVKGTWCLLQANELNYILTIVNNLSFCTFCFQGIFQCYKRNHRRNKHKKEKI